MASHWAGRWLVLAPMRLWEIKLPGLLWVTIFLLAYVVIKAPADGVWILSLPARLISAVGSFVIEIARSYGAPS